MRLALLIVMMLCLPAVADTPKPQPPKPAPKPAPVKERLEATLRAVEVPKPIYYCGILAFRTVVRFEVISVESGSWTDKEIFAVVLCPEWVKLGKPIKVVLEKPTASDQGYVDKFAKGPRWVIRKTL